MRVVLRSVAGWMVVFVITALLLEVMLRALVLLPGSTGSLVSDPDVGIAGVPMVTDGEITTNSAGFNDREPLPGGVPPRGVFIGDSFTFGFTRFDDTFPHRVEVAMGGRESFPVANLGVIGTGPQEYLAMIRKRALPMRPEWIIVTLFVGNDFLQANLNYRTIIYMGKIRLMPDPRWLGTAWDEYYLPKAVRSLTRALLPVTDDRIAACATRPETAARLSPALFDVYSNELVNYEEPYGSLAERGFDGLTRLILEMADAAKTAGVQPLFVIAPSEIQLDSDLRQTLMRCLGREHVTYDFHKPQRLLSAFLESRQLAYLDLWPALSRYPTTRTYLPHETHWNHLGNDIAAGAIAAKLTELHVSQQTTMPSGGMVQKLRTRSE